jgi:hypothetical protein
MEQTELLDRHPGRAWRSWLARPRLPWLLALAAVALTLPALGIGWQLDDHFQRLVMLRTAETDISSEEAFSVLDGDVELNRLYLDLGYLPWWTPEDFRLAFFRPLALATTRLDYELWPGSAPLMHLHSLLWFAALVGAAAVLYRRLLEPAWVGGLAALLYAIDDAHGSPAAWLANRNALLATLFGILCLLAHDYPLLLALGLASAEAALATTAYLLAYALFIESGKPRLRSLLPYLPVLLAWATAYRLGGYGASSSGLYLDPLRSPLAYARALLERAPFSLMGQWTPIPAELGSLPPPEVSLPSWLLAVALVTLVALALLPVLWRDRGARFWGLGMLLSLLPISATFPSNRLLAFVGLGAMGLLARFFQLTLTTRDRSRHSGPRFRLGVARALVATHLVLAPLLLLLGPVAIRQLGEPMLIAAESLGSDPRLAEQDLIIANAPDYLMFVTNLPTLQALNGRPLPRRLRALSIGPTAVRLTRTGEAALRVDLERGLFGGPLGRLFRDAEDPLRIGSTVHVAGLEIEVLALASDGSPAALEYRFEKPLDDPSLHWVRWQDGRYVEFEPPAVGRAQSLAKAVGPLDRFGW